MFRFIGDELGENGDKLSSYSSCIFQGKPLAAPPWGNSQFDCILISIDHVQARELAASFSEEIVKHSVDWVETTGPHAQLIHDLVDQASVEAGCQEAVGCGFPMTAWHEDALSLDQMVDVAESCLGGADHVLCLVIGSPDQHDQFHRRLRDRLLKRIP